MNNDLSEVSVGDYVWTVFDGWTKVTGKESSFEYPILLIKRDSYTKDGRRSIDDKYPTAFLTPPAGFNAEPKPYIFEKGQKVLVSDFKGVKALRRYFSHMDGERFHCYNDGTTQWSSKETNFWKFCMPAEEG